MLHSIYAVETKIEKEGGGEPSFHSFLLFAEVSAEGDLTPLQELHFVFSERQVAEGDGKQSLKKVPCLKGITKPANRNYDEMIFDEVVSGSHEDVLSQWNRMAEIAASISAVHIRFTQNAKHDAVNCRTGTKSVLKALGYDFKPLTTNANSGVNVCVLDKVDDIIVDATPLSYSPEAIRALQQKFPLNFSI